MHLDPRRPVTLPERCRRPRGMTIKYARAAEIGLATGPAWPLLGRRPID